MVDVKKFNAYYVSGLLFIIWAFGYLVRSWDGVFHLVFLAAVLTVIAKFISDNINQENYHTKNIKK